MLTKEQKENQKKLCKKAFKLRWEVDKINRKEAKKIFLSLCGAHMGFINSDIGEEKKQEAIKLLRAVKRAEKYLEDMYKKIDKIYYYEKNFPGKEKVIDTPGGFNRTFEEFENRFGPISRLEIKE